MYMFRSRREVDPINLRPSDLDIRDIAHNLSMICRFTGSFPFHYSVAHHSLLVSQTMQRAGWSREACLAGLLHDAGEYVFNDLSRPIKHHPTLAPYKELEHKTTEMIMNHFGASPVWMEIIKPYDTQIWELEEKVRRGESWHIPAMGQATVYNRFLGEFDRLSLFKYSLSSSSSYFELSLMDEP